MFNGFILEQSGVLNGNFKNIFIQQSLYVKEVNLLASKENFSKDYRNGKL